MTTVNVEHIIKVLNRHKVAFLLIGGVNFLLRHRPELTYDVDIWVEDTDRNLDCCEKALVHLKAEWGRSDDDWRPVAEHKQGWLRRQMVYCLTSPDGSIDVFRKVKGLDDWHASFMRAARGNVGSAPFFGLSDEDMLKCQKALSKSEQKQDRIRFLERVIRRNKR